MSDNPHVQRLAAYRLERDLTFEGLAAEMAAAGFPVRARALHWALTGRLQRGPLERTQHRIEGFIAHLDRRAARRRKRAAKKARATAPAAQEASARQ